MERPTPASAPAAEFNVIAGYRAVGGIVSGGSSLMVATILSGRLHNKHGDPIPTSLNAFFAPMLLVGIVLLLAEWRVTLSPATETASIRRGLWPFVGSREVDLSGGRSFRVTTARGQYGIGVNVDLELDHDPRRIAVLRNATRDSFEAAIEAAHGLRAFLLLQTPPAEAPRWLTDEIEAANARLPARD